MRSVGRRTTPKLDSDRIHPGGIHRDPVNQFEEGKGISAYAADAQFQDTEGCEAVLWRTRGEASTDQAAHPRPSRKPVTTMVTDSTFTPNMREERPLPDDLVEESRES